MSHRLRFDHDVAPDDVFALALNRYPEAVLEGATIRLTENSSLSFDALTESWELTAPVERDSADAPVVTDTYGLNAAFAEGAPVGEEADVLAFVLGALRRLGGSLETDSGEVLEPHPFSLPDVKVVSPYALLPEQTLEVVRDIVPEARLDGIPADDAEGTDEPPLPYALVLPIFSDADLEVRVEPFEVPIPAIAHVDWVREGALTYQVLYQPHNEAGIVGESADDAELKKWREAYLGCGAIAKKLHDTVGGFVLDAEEFLISPADLM